MSSGKSIRTFVGATALIVATAIITTQVVSQDSEQQPDAMDAQRQLWVKYATPTDHHKKLEVLIGDWEQTVQMWWYPGAEPQQSTSTATYKWIMDGRFVQGQYTGSFEDQPFTGMDILGYDNFREQYISTWLDNMTTSFMTSSGTFNRTGSELRMQGTNDDIMTGEEDKPFKTVWRIIDEDSMIYEMHAPGPDGEFFKTLEVRSTRK